MNFTGGVRPPTSMTGGVPGMIPGMTGIGTTSDLRYDDYFWAHNRSFVCK